MPEAHLERLSNALADRYAVEREIGAGGMATVYLARDLKHNRRVALKVLKPELAAVVGAERFLAEIETTANLQHPHILPLYDSGEADGFLFYVMPYVEGETVRDRLDREKQLPVDVAVRIATAVANALDYAHRHGVVHRDIKPGNIMLQAGEPVVGDFGIALAVGSAGAARLTETGLSVGTPFYMSPEQATGDMQVGPSTDIYALGAVLYELLTGDPPYTGRTAQAVLGQIITGEPVSAIARRRSIPPHVDAAVRKALEKLPADRFPDAGAFSAALADPAFRYGGGTGRAVRGDPGLWRPLAIAASVAALAASIGLAFQGRARPESPRQVERFAGPFLPGDELSFTGGGSYALSPDGTILVYRHDPGTGIMLYARRWDELRATPIRDTDGAVRPAISPDGLEVAFAQDGQVKALAFAGGATRTLGAGGIPSWGPDGYVYFSGEGGSFRVRSTGGVVERVTTLGTNETVHVPGQVLSDGTRLLLGVATPNGIDLRTVDLESREMETVVRGIMAAPVRVISAGYLLYQADGNLMAAPMDLARGSLTGAPVPVLSGVAGFTISDNGKLFYTRGATGGDVLLSMQWVDRSGAVTPVDPSWTVTRGGDVNFGFSISPDGTRLAIREETTEGYDIWIKQLDRGPRSRLTFGAAHERMPVWSPDGRSVYFLSDRAGNNDVWKRSADGTGQPELVLDLEESLATIELSPNGAWLLARSATGGAATSARNVFAVDLTRDRVAIPVLAGDYSEVGPTISPGGRWIAYSSDETGRYEIYVRPFPNVELGRWQISAGGGRAPHWAHSGGEIFFQDPQGHMMAASVSTAGDALVAGAPEKLFDGNPAWLQGNITGTFYDVAPDDRRFLVAATVSSPTAGEGDDTPTGILVNNFDVELARLVPRGR